MTSRAVGTPIRTFRHFQLDDVLLVREAGLDTQALSGLHHDEFDYLLGRARRLETEAEARFTALAADLYDTVGLLSGGARTAALALRRAILRGRADQATIEATRMVLPASSVASLNAWSAARAEAALANEAIAQCAVHCLAVEMAHLRHLCSDPAFVHGLRATNADLAATAERWAVDPDAQPQRKRILALARMAARAGAKTSPFSTWMTVVPAIWGTPGSAVTITSQAVELDGRSEAWIIERLNDTLLAPTERALRINPSLIRDGNEYVFIRDQGAGSSVRVRIHAVIDTLLGLPRTGVALDELAMLAGTNEATISQLLALGVLESCSPVADQDERPWVAWSKLSRQAGNSELAVDLAELDTALQGASITAVRGAGDQLLRRLGFVGPDTRAGSGDPEVHEITTAGAPRDDVPQRPADDIVAELDLARRLLALHDYKLAVKLAAAEVLRREFGEDYDLPLTRAVELFWIGARGRCPDLATVAGPSAPPWGADLRECKTSTLRRLGDWQHGCVDAVLRTAATGNAISAAQVRALLDTAPIQHPNRSATCYLQELSAGATRFVLNVVHGGHGRGRGRLARQADIPVERLVPEVDPDTVEIAGLLGSTLNRRFPVAPRELQYPGSTTDRPVEEQLAMSEVRAVAGADGLAELRDAAGRLVRPVHLGMAADLALPPLARVIEQVFGSSFLVHPSTPVFVPSRPGSYPAESRTPRVVLGGTVLQRERLFVRRGMLPESRPDKPSAREWFTWLADRGMASRFFLRAWNPVDATRQSKARKPLYVDVTSPLLLADAEKLLKHATFAIIEECLPDPLTVPGRTRELAVQVGETP